MPSTNRPVQPGSLFIKVKWNKETEDGIKQYVLLYNHNLLCLISFSKKYLSHRNELLGRWEKPHHYHQKMHRKVKHTHIKNVLNF